MLLLTNTVYLFTHVTGLRPATKKASLSRKSVSYAEDVIDHEEQEGTGTSTEDEGDVFMPSHSK